MFRRLVLLLITTTLPIIFFAQGQVGSPYSRYGVGDVYNNSQARITAMGGAGYASPYQNDVNLKNPACVGNIDTLTMIFNFGLEAGLRTYKVANPSTSLLKPDAQLSQISVGFSFARWWKSAIVISPYSNVDFSVYSSDNKLDIDKQYVYNGDGGLNKITWANAFKPVKNLSLAVGVSYIFGKIYHSNAIIFPRDSVGTYINGFTQKTYKISDITFDAGIKYDIPLENDLISIGAYYGYNRQMSAKRSVLAYNTLSAAASTIVDTIYSDSNTKGKIGLPHTIGLGLSYTYNDKLTVAGDFTMQNWTNSQFFGESDSLSNSFGGNLGFEFTPNKVSPRNIWQSSSYRLGFYYSNSYININSEQTAIPDYGLCFGIGFAPRYARTVFNVTFQIGQRGSLKNNLVKENYYVLGINLNLVDKWFVKSKID